MAQEAVLCLKLSLPADSGISHFLKPFFVKRKSNDVDGFVILILDYITSYVYFCNIARSNSN
jgi:hypothetical protein